ncbi:MAG: hypothetical protein PVH54_10325 [Gammaproteobacteria bacterium]|jgi:hypothetical protein
MALAECTGRTALPSRQRRHRAVRLYFRVSVSASLLRTFNYRRFLLQKAGDVLPASESFAIFFLHPWVMHLPVQAPDTVSI